MRAFVALSFFLFPLTSMAELKCLVDVNDPQVAVTMFEIAVKQKDADTLTAAYEDELLSVSARLDLKAGNHDLILRDKKTDAQVEAGGSFNANGFIGTSFTNKDRTLGLYCFEKNESLARWLRAHPTAR
jgi:hypothetical protein